MLLSAKLLPISTKVRWKDNMKKNTKIDSKWLVKAKRMRKQGMKYKDVESALYNLGLRAPSGKRVSMIQICSELIARYPNLRSYKPRMKKGSTLADWAKRLDPNHRMNGVAKTLMESNDLLASLATEKKQDRFLTSDEKCDLVGVVLGLSFNKKFEIATKILSEW